MPENIPPINNIRKAHDAGFGPLVPVIPVGASLYGGRRFPSGDFDPPLTLKSSLLGKVPGIYSDGSWNLRNCWRECALTEEDIGLHDDGGGSCDLITDINFGMFDIDTTDLALAAALRRAEIGGVK